MKNILFAALLLIPTISSAQDTTMVSIPRASLTPQQLKQVEVQQVSEWAGRGKEVGEAINSSLAAVTENTAKFADTKVGKFTMFIIAWKVLSDDLVGIVWAFSLAGFGFPTLLWSYRRWTRPSTLIKEIRNDNGKVIERVYETHSVHVYEGGAFLHLVAGVGLVIACSLILIG